MGRNETEIELKSFGDYITEATMFDKRIKKIEAIGPEFSSEQKRAAFYLASNVPMSRLKYNTEKDNLFVVYKKNRAVEFSTKDTLAVFLQDGKVQHTLHRSNLTVEERWLNGKTGPEDFSHEI